MKPGPFSLENTYIGYIQILFEELDHLRAMSWVRLCTRPISVTIDNRADPFSWIRLGYRQTGASRSETFDLSSRTLPPLSSRSYTSRQFRDPSRVAIQSRPRSCCTKRLLLRTRIAVEDTDEQAFGSPASCVMISDTSTWSRKPCNPSTTRSAS